MRLIGLAVVLVIGLTLTPLAGEAQQASKLYRIGDLVPGTAAATAPFIAVFRQALNGLGYVEGKNFVLEIRYSETAESHAQNAEELARLGVDVIVVTTTTSALAAQRATNTIPIVMVSAGDPVQAGLVESLARPGGNITGNGVLFPELTVKQLEFMKQTLVKASRVLVLGNWSNPSTPPARGLNVRLESLDFRAPEVDLDTILATALARQKSDALLVLADPLLFFRYARIADLALSHRLAAIAFWREFALSGGLMSYGPNLVELIRRSAWYVDKILKGAKPADLPVEQPTKYDLVVNLKTAKALRLTIPQSLLLRADQVIE
jgi:ABC-type uncharacterized transport system substrate-binding protein